ncbi:hypothetical protein FRB90_011694 [Tulasnella sp. 427]|nr:hypothetical protein FRB90_011694 [Tulasnella sp. 427]
MPRHTPTESYGAVEIGSLQRLCIIRSPPSIVTLLMGMIGVPNLEQLSVHFSGEVDPTSTRTFWNLLPVNVTAIQLLGTPHPRIRRLDLISCEAEPSFLRDTLDNLPALEWLRIASSALTDKHLEALVVVPFDPDLVRAQWSAASNDADVRNLRNVINSLGDAIHSRESNCDCRWLEYIRSTDEADSDIEDGTFCGILNLQPDEDSLFDENLVQILEVQLDLLDKRSDGVPSSIVDKIRGRLALEESKKHSRSKAERGQTRSPSPSESTEDPPASPQPSTPTFEILPLELILHILTLAKPFDPHLHFTLSHLNRSIRSFINSSPIFWTEINFLYPLPLILLYIERSSDSPLHIVADDGGGRTLASYAWQQQIDRIGEHLAPLRNHRHRIRSLRVSDGDAAYWGLDRRDMTKVPAPRPDPSDNFLWNSLLCNLECLDLEFLDWDVNIELVMPPVANLRKLRLCGRWNAHYLPLFAPQLESVALQGSPSVSLDVILTALAAIPTLTRLVFADLNSKESASRTSLTFEGLDDLSLTRCSRSTVQRILQDNKFPSLTSLSIHFSIERRMPNSTGVRGTQLFSIGLPALQALELVDHPSSSNFLLNTLQWLPALFRLRIASSSMQDVDLQSLVVPEHTRNGVLCPRLSSLTVDNEFNVTSSMIRRIITSRHAASSPLKSLTLRGLDGTKVTAEDMEDLDAFGVTELYVDVFYADNHEIWTTELDSGTEDSSEGEWLSGDDEILAPSKRLKLDQSIAGLLSLQTHTAAWPDD